MDLKTVEPMKWLRKISQDMFQISVMELLRRSQIRYEMTNQMAKYMHYRHACDHYMQAECGDTSIPKGHCDECNSMHDMVAAKMDILLVEEALSKHIRVDREDDFKQVGSKRILTSAARRRIRIELQEQKQTRFDRRMKYVLPVLTALTSLAGAYIGAKLKH